MPSNQPETPTPDALDAAVEEAVQSTLSRFYPRRERQKFRNACLLPLIAAVEARAVARERGRECAWTPAKSGVKNRKVTGCHNIITCDYPITVRCDFCGGRVRVAAP
jgi:hypothetical protein